MHVEIRKKGKKTKYYLAHSFREGGKVRKIRKYLGEGISKDQIKEKLQKAEWQIKETLKIYNEIKDPLKNLLTNEELDHLKMLSFDIGLKIQHLSEKDWQRFAEAFTYDTNAIEGSTVTLGEVKNIIEGKEWPRDASKEDIAETYGVAEAVHYIRQTKEHVSINLIKKLHSIVFANSKHFAGKLRPKGVEVVIRDGRGNIVHQGAPATKITALIRELAGWYEVNKANYHPIILAAVIHNQFESIHPFQDGNGRVGRLLLNNILIKHGLPPVNIELKNRAEYYTSLQEYQSNGNLRPTIDLILKEYKILKRHLKR
ncbi:MAG: Fic family protein [Candidatus Woesearchaeota archaeon]